MRFGFFSIYFRDGYFGKYSARLLAADLKRAMIARLLRPPDASAIAGSAFMLGASLSSVRASRDSPVSASPTFSRVISGGDFDCLVRRMPMIDACAHGMILD